MPRRKTRRVARKRRREPPKKPTPKVTPKVSAAAFPPAPARESEHPRRLPRERARDQDRAMPKPAEIYLPPLPEGEAGVRTMVEGWPWSRWGREMVDRIPRIAVPSESTMPAGRFISPIWQAGDIGYTGPPGSKYGAVELRRGGATVPHEFTHAAGFRLGLYGQPMAPPSGRLERMERFTADLIDYLFRHKEPSEWTEQERLVFDRLLSEGPDEAHAHFANRPDLMPPELEHWYPHFDLTRRRAMGVPQRLGYKGPSLPPPPPGIGYGSRTWR